MAGILFSGLFSLFSFNFSIIPFFFYLLLHIHACGTSNFLCIVGIKSTPLPSSHHLAAFLLYQMVKGNHNSLQLVRLATAIMALLGTCIIARIESIDRKACLACIKP